MLVLDKQMTSMQYIDFFIENIRNETITQIIDSGLMNLSTVVSQYIPTESVKDTKAQLFDKLLYDLLCKQDNLPRPPILDKLFSFIGNKSQLDACIAWMTRDSPAIEIEGKVISELFKKHRHAILHKMF
jgi:hypothetical protein